VKVQLLSTIGQPINEPCIAMVEITVSDQALSTVKGKVEEIVREQLNAVDALTDRLALGDVNLY